MTRRCAVFLARDGVLNHAPVHEGLPVPPRDPCDFAILPGVREACVRLREHGFLLVVVTNQPDAGRARQSRVAVSAMHDILVQHLPIDRIEVCYDGGDARSIFRKPETGMLLRVAADWNVDLRSSFMVGHRWRDIECGRAAGCTTLLIDRDYCEPVPARPHYRVRSLTEAAEQIINSAGLQCRCATATSLAPR